MIVVKPMEVTKAICCGMRISFSGVQTVLDDAGATENLLRQLHSHIC